MQRDVDLNRDVVVARGSVDCDVKIRHTFRSICAGRHVARIRMRWMHEDFQPAAIFKITL